MNKVDFQPEGCKLLVKVETVKAQTEGGIYLPDNAREQEQYATVRGEVVKIGPGVMVEFYGEPFKVGDVVIFAKYGGNVIEDKSLDGVHRILNDQDILIRVVNG